MDTTREETKTFRRGKWRGKTILWRKRRKRGKTNPRRNSSVILERVCNKQFKFLKETEKSLQSHPLFLAIFHFQSRTLQHSQNPLLPLRSSYQAYHSGLPCSTSCTFLPLNMSADSLNTYSTPLSLLSSFLKIQKICSIYWLYGIRRENSKATILGVTTCNNSYTSVSFANTFSVLTPNRVSSSCSSIFSADDSTPRHPNQELLFELGSSHNWLNLYDINKQSAHTTLRFSLLTCYCSSEANILLRKAQGVQSSRRQVPAFLCRNPQSPFLLEISESTGTQLKAYTTLKLSVWFFEVLKG